MVALVVRPYVCVSCILVGVVSLCIDIYGRVYCPCMYSYFYDGGVNCVFLYVVFVVASLCMCCVEVKQV